MVKLFTQVSRTIQWSAMNASMASHWSVKVHDDVVPTENGAEQFPSAKVMKLIAINYKPFTIELLLIN